MSEAITSKLILKGHRYEPAPDCRYEIARGVIAEMVEPTEYVIEQFDYLNDQIQKAAGLDEAAKGSTDVEVAGALRTSSKLRQFCYDQCEAVLEIVEGQFDLSDPEARKQLIWPVCARVSEDFFFIKGERTSEHMKSFLDEMRDLLSLRETLKTQNSEANPSPGSGNGRLNGEAVTEGGLSGHSG